MPEISNARIREILVRKERGEKLTIAESKIAERALAGFPEKEPESELSEALPENNVVDENVTVLDNQFEGFDAKYEIETKATLIAMSKEITPESDPKATSNIASAISNNIYRNYRAAQNARLSSGEDVKSDTYGDKETFDALSDMAQKTKDVSARARVAHSMGNIIIIGDKSTRDLYDNDQTKSMLRESFLGAKESADIGSLAFAINCHQGFVSKKEKPFTSDPEVMKKMMDSLSSPNLKIRDQGLVAGLFNLAIADENLTASLATKENLDTILAASRKLNADNDKDEIGRRNMSGALGNILKNNPDLAQGEAALEAKSLLINWAKTVNDHHSIKAISGALSDLSKSKVDKDKDGLFAGQDAKETLIEMAKNATSAVAVASVFGAIASVNWQLHEQRKYAKENGLEGPAELYDDKETYDFIMTMAEKMDGAKGKDGDDARGAIAGAIASISLGEKGGERFCNQETKELMLNWGNKAKSDNAIIGVASAISSIALHESNMLKKQAQENNKSIFYNDPEIKDVLATMDQKLKAGQDGQDHSRAENAVKTAQKSSSPREQKSEQQSWADRVPPPKDSQPVARESTEGQTWEGKVAARAASTSSGVNLP